MPKPRTLGPAINYNCDICNFKVTNNYIFKRHLHRCYTLHGIASKRSSSRHPLRLKGTEGVKSVGGDTGRFHCEEDVQESTNTPIQINGGDESIDKMEEFHDNETEILDVDDEGGSVEEDIDLLSHSPTSSSQWGVKDSPIAMTGDACPQDENEDDDDEDESRIVSLNGDNDNDDTMDTSAVTGMAYHVENERSLTDSPNSSISKAKFERNYLCEYCPFNTVKSRDYLYHLRDNHGERLKIFECDLCDYASRYNNKLSRHMAVHNKMEILNIPGQSDVVTDQNLDMASLQSPQNLDLKVKPLKLKRLHVKTPSMFQVTHESKVKRKLQASPPMGKDVFKMVLSADGSHDYQCRDCLFYANTAIAVKRHYSLCHSKFLQCGQCEFNTRSQAEYYEHIITHDGRITYHKCPDCSYVTHAKPTFENHRSHHGSSAPFKCRVCNFAADSESKVKRHMATQHTNRNDDQEDSVSVEEGRQLPTTVSDAADGWIDDDTERQEFTESTEAMGMSMAGGASKPYLQSMGPSIMKSKKHLVKFKCPHCLVVCLRRANLTRHLIAKHDYSQTQASFSSKSMEKQLLRRRPAQKPYTSASSLVSSAASKFIRLQGPSADGQDDLHCPECPYVAKWPSDLRRHQQVHTMVKRFKCPICTSKYKYLGDLNVHMRRDHLMEPQQHTIAEEVVISDVVKKSSPAVFRCPICAFATGTKADLEQHSRQHGDIEKTFQCRLCDYQTYWRGDVGRHLFRHHKIHLSKDGHELEKHFIFRSDIRPLTKMSMSFKAEHNIDDVPPESQNEINSTPSVNLQTFEEKVNFKNILRVPHSSGGKEGGGREGSLVCSNPSCEYRTASIDKMEVHMAAHDNIKIFQCATCGKRANYKWDIVKHTVRVHKNPSATTDDVLQMPISEARETISDYLASFERKVVESPTFQCSLCDFKSGERSLVEQHLNENHVGQKRHVSIASSSVVASIKQEAIPPVEEAPSSAVIEDSKDYKFVEPSPEELAKHDKPYACGICKKAELTLMDMQRHYNYTHPYKDVRVIYNPDGTEFNMDTLDIYPSVKKSPAAAENFLHVDDSPSALGSQQTSPHSGKTVRPDSKYSNPKMHGYVKPFKCSVCGLRSNWKWDLKKHLRSKHPQDGGFVIMLSIEEASMTYGTECSRSHPKCENQTSVSDVNTHTVNLSPSGNDSFIPASPYKTKSGQPPGAGTRYDPRRRQWKCSGCDYITNWRRNMARHMSRRHRENRHELKVISLHMLDNQERESILEERKSRMEKTGKFVVDLDDEEECDEEGDEGGNDFLSESNLSGSADASKLPSGDAGPGSGDVGRLWKCPRCSYHSTLRTHIIIHMQKHELRPFLCAVCNVPFMNRSPLHSHIQRVHGRLDYIKLVKVNIRYDGVVDQFHLGQALQCTICRTKFTDKLSIVEHLQSTHGVEANGDYVVVTAMDNNHSSYSSISGSKLFAINGGKSDVSAIIDGAIIRRKVHYCRLCPYTTQKKSMLSFHMTYHKPTPANRFKCKHCPYYVSTTRLLHQHQRKWHSDSKKTDVSSISNISAAAAHPASMLWEYPQSTPPSSPYKQRGGESGTPRRHACEKCPYTTNCKNDFYYHKQFHRPKRTAEYKCEFCDYWVVHKRLLKQHMRLHEQANSMEEVSPAKSVYSDPGLVYDPVELTELAAMKQNMISAKILPSLSKSPKVSPMKIASRCSAGDKPGYVLKNGLYRKLHKCPKCPYTNTRARNMNLHIMMHGPRESSCPLIRCPYCDYYVGSKGLLSHHMKVHQKQYGDTPEKDARRASLGLNDDDDEGDDSDDMVDIQAEQKVDTLLQISRMKRFGCEKCPYASAKRQHFERHLELHGSRQRYTCQYCDYSVPSSYLLTQHSRLHMMPNQNLLLCQSVNNLQHVSEVPADVALASALPPSDCDMSVTISVIHDHLGLYENSIYDPEQKKLYRCDRCPYANVRRDHLLSHLKFHMVSSSFVCPYCDYSAPKQALLTQHIRVHFCPLPELSDWLLENGQTERATSQKNIDMAEALKVAQEYQSQSKKKGKAKEGEIERGTDGAKAEEKENIDDKSANGPDSFICQYCDREFVTSEKLLKHELQHLIGNQFEMALKKLKTGKPVEVPTKDKPATDNKGSVCGSSDNTPNGDAALQDGGKKSEVESSDIQKEESSQESIENEGANGKSEKNEVEVANGEEKAIENDKGGATAEDSSENNAESAVKEGSGEEEKLPKDEDVNMTCDDDDGSGPAKTESTEAEKCIDSTEEKSMSSENKKAELDLDSEGSKVGQKEEGSENENLDVDKGVEEDCGKNNGDEKMDVDENVEGSDDSTKSIHSHSESQNEREGATSDAKTGSSVSVKTQQGENDDDNDDKGQCGSNDDKGQGGSNDDDKGQGGSNDDDNDDKGQAGSNDEDDELGANDTEDGDVAMDEAEMEEELLKSDDGDEDDGEVGEAVVKVKGSEGTVETLVGEGKKADDVSGGDEGAVETLVGEGKKADDDDISGGDEGAVETLVGEGKKADDDDASGSGGDAGGEQDGTRWDDEEQDMSS